ncbi:nucleotidyltransferase [Weissella viridescens]|uniref:tRNA(Met) cytidine acetate ligase n=1 Tax=Weissella viridescens TaxID=1629 RepID=A0A3P2RMD2_WEIVI|nr:nucleotidyltransferase [Weissella viridescens]RRG18862.1 nucleotidyltransferase [Weissella viridescens]
MRAVGLITEYNPFHNGHHFHVQEAKRLTGADVVVAVMSGNFVQRGMPAVMDKWQRTQLALEGGLNLVVELPIAFAVQPAHLFARGAVALLADLQVETIVFGAEHAELDFIGLAQTAHATLAHSEHFKQDYTKTYATQFNDVIQALIGYRIESPNDLLGFAYANAVIELGLQQKITLQPIQRKQAQYHDRKLDQHAAIASATALRLASGHGIDELQQYMSAAGAALLAQGEQTEPVDGAWLTSLLYKVRTTPVVDLEQIYQLNDGLAYRLKTLIEKNQYQTVSELLDDFKSKRYTRARLSRSLLYVLLNMTQGEVTTALHQPYSRILGQDQIGRKYLKHIRDLTQYPVINRVSHQDVTSIMALDYRAGMIYQLFTRPEFDQRPQDTGRIPIYFER